MTNKYTQRYFKGWKSRECSADGILQPFSQAEVEHICLINDHLKQLTEEVVMKAQRVSKLFLSELAHGNKDYEDYEIAATISMTYDEDDGNYDEELKRLIDYTWKQPDFEPIRLSSNMSEQEQSEWIAETLKLYQSKVTLPSLYQVVFYRHYTKKMFSSKKYQSIIFYFKKHCN